MPGELDSLRRLRPPVHAPRARAVARAREVLSAEMDAEPRASRPQRWSSRWGARRWLVPSIAVVALGAGGLAAAGLELTDWWTGADPPVRPDEVAAVLDHEDSPRGASTGAIDAQVELARTVARAPGASLVAAPADDGRNVCIVRVPETGEVDLTCFGGDFPQDDFFTDWVHGSGHGRAWYLLGRVRDPGAARLALFDEVTHPFEQGTASATEPQLVEVGPGGFFLARVPETRWAGLDLAYASFSILDESGALLRRICRYIGPSPVTPLALGGRMGPGPLDAKDSDGLDERTCPPSGSAVRAATLAPVTSPRKEMADLPGRDLVTGEPFSLSLLAGERVILAMIQDLAVVETSGRLLLELRSFSRRHPDVQVVVVVHSVHHDMRRLAEALGLGFPVVQVQAGANAPVRAFLDARGQSNPFVLALDERGDVTGELAVPDPELGVQHALLTQQVLDRLLATATSG